MKKFILTFFAACLVTALSATTVNYTALPDSIFPNPERGFLHQCTRHANGSYNAITNSKKTEIENYMTQDKISLVLVLYYLDEFNNTATLPEAVFTAFEEDMQVLRDYGLKAIFRIAYAENSYGSGAAESAHDAPLYIIKSHLAQYKSHWQANADVIFCFQAGFVGQYGEWYYTENFGNHVSTLNDSCRALLDTALNAIPRDRTLLLRRPMFKMEYLDGVALTAEEAYTGTAKARLGHYNDAFLYNDDNMGTYSSNATKRAAQKALIAQETNYVPLGGETDITEASQAASQASHDSTVAEMSTMHWTFIKNTYSETVTDMWRNNGTFDELNCKLGYRFQLNNGQYSDTVVYGNNLSVNMNIQNLGFAPLYNRRPAYIVLKNNQHSYQLRLSADPRTWKPNNVISNVNENITIADSIAKGKYNLYLYLPDAYASIAADSRYAVRFANEGVWDSETGMNSLLATVFITDGQGSVELPATLNKANVDSYSDDMTWYGTNGDFFNIGDGDHENLSRWAEWKVNLTTPGWYNVTEVTNSPNQHQYLLALLSGTDTIAKYTTKKFSTSGKDSTYLNDSKWDLCNVRAGEYRLRVKNMVAWGQPKLKSITLDLVGEVSSDTITLSAALNKENVSYYTEKIGWYNTDYFDFGVKDADNTDHYVEWTVNLRYQGNYTVETVGSYPNGHQWQMQLLNSTAATYSLPANYTEGDVTETGSTKWDLSEVATGVYKLRIQNTISHGRPKLLRLTLTYDGEIPSGIEKATEEVETDGQMYDILGRPVDESYRGVVIMRGKKQLRL